MGKLLRAIYIIVQNFFKDVGRLLHVTGFKSAAYALLSVTFFGTAAAYLVAPEATLTGVLTYARSRDCILLWQAVGAAALMLPAWTFSLKVRMSAHVSIIHAVKVQGVRLAGCPLRRHVIKRHTEEQHYDLVAWIIMATTLHS